MKDIQNGKLKKYLLISIVSIILVGIVACDGMKEKKLQGETHSITEDRETIIESRSTHIENDISEEEQYFEWPELGLGCILDEEWERREGSELRDYEELFRESLKKGGGLIPFDLEKAGYAIYANNYNEGQGIAVAYAYVGAFSQMVEIDSILEGMINNCEEPANLSKNLDRVYAESVVQTFLGEEHEVGKVKGVYKNGQVMYQKIVLLKNEEYFIIVDISSVAADTTDEILENIFKLE